MHNTAFNVLGVNAVYKLFPLKEDELKHFFDAMREPSSPIFGLNVTIPYKEKVIDYLDALSPFAKKTMAVNTVVISPDRQLIGHNTDGPGFLAHLTELAFDLNDKRVAILGGGGTTRAILAAMCLLPEKPHAIRLYNRTISRAHQLVNDLSQRINMKCVEIVNTITDLNIELCDLLINTTPIGLKAGDPCPIDPRDLHSNLLVYDVIYNPRETKLLKLAKAKGAKTANGLGMLFYQGVLAFQHWADEELDAEVKKAMRKSLEGALK